MLWYQAVRHRKMLLPDRNQCVLSNIYLCVFSIVFCRLFSCRVSAYRFPSWTGGQRCKSLLSPKSILLLFYLLPYLCLSLSLSYWDSLCSLIAEWILEWRHRNGCFPMWCRFSSIQVYIVNSLHYRGHVFLLQISGRSLPVSFSLLMCIFTVEFQSESSTCRVCVIMSSLHYWYWGWLTAKL